MSSSKNCLTQNWFLYVCTLYRQCLCTICFRSLSYAELQSCPMPWVTMYWFYSYSLSSFQVFKFYPYNLSSFQVTKRFIHTVFPVFRLSKVLSILSFQFSGYQMFYPYSLSSFQVTKNYHSTKQYNMGFFYFLEVVHFQVVT